MLLIDTHAHLDYDNIQDVIKNMGSNIIIASGYNTSSNKKIIDFSNKYPNVFGVIGIHPEEIDSVGEEDFKFIEENIQNPNIVGIGEIGLDYHFRDDNKEAQKTIFIRQLNMAQKYNKSVVIHARDSISDVYSILKSLNLSINIDLHCYSSSLEMAYKFIQLGCRFGVSGVLTFKNSLKLQNIVKQLDIKYLLLETDSPYLTPEPLRGKLNEPANVRFVAQKIADIKGISVESVVLETFGNAVKQFDLNIQS